MNKTEFNCDIEKTTILFFNNLSEKDKRLFAGLQSMGLGYYGVTEISKKFNLSKQTIRIEQ